MKTLLCAVVAALILSACGKTVSVPQNQLRAVAHTDTLLLHNIPEKDRGAALAKSLCSRPAGSASAVVTLGTGLPKNTRKQMTDLLARYGIPATEIAWRTGEKKQLEVTVTCLYLEQNVPEKRPMSGYWFSRDPVSPVYGAAMELNLAKQLARTRDLDKPHATGDPNPLAAVGAVERYQKGESRGLGDQSVEVGTSGQ